MISLESLRPPGIYRLVCRPALPKDTPDVLELTRQIWEGHDYIPMVWEDWLHDSEGLLAVAEYGGHVVGLSKLTRLSPSEWWLEGLRVHPDYQGRGIASRLHDYLANYWQRYGGTIRLVTASSRVQVHHLSLRSGFRKVVEVTSYVAQSVEGLSPRFAGVRPGEERESVAFALSHPSPTFPNGLMDIGWQWASPSAEHIAGAIARGRAWWWGSEHGERRALLVAREDDYADDGLVLLIQLLVCPPEHLAACLEDYRSLAGSLGLKQASWFAPLDPALEPALLAAGYQRDWENSLYIFEKKGE